MRLNTILLHRFCRWCRPHNANIHWHHGWATQKQYRGACADFNGKSTLLYPILGILHWTECVPKNHLGIHPPMFVLGPSTLHYISQCHPEKYRETCAPMVPCRIPQTNLAVASWPKNWMGNREGDKTNAWSTTPTYLSLLPSNYNDMMKMYM